MRIKLIAIALAAVFPLGAYAQGVTKPDQQQRPGASSSSPAPQGAAGGSSAGTARLDINRDGVISREEAKASSELSSRFNELDKNRDGSLSAEELSSSGGGSGGSGSSPMKR